MTSWSYQPCPYISVARLRDSRLPFLYDFFAAASAAHVAPPSTLLKISARSLVVVAFGTAAIAYITFRFDGAAATVIRPTPLRTETPVERAQLDPPSLLNQICPLVVPDVAAGVASSVTTRRGPAPLSMLHACGAAVCPVASGTRVQLAPASIDRKSPL